MQSELSHDEALRYNRQIMLRGFDFDGQEKLKAAKALIVGLGGLGCAASPYLASAGVGQLTLLDFDTVSLSNLQRQILHHETAMGQTKVASARRQLQAINPHLSVVTVNAQLNDAALSALIGKQDVVLDCSDNIATREQLNRLCFSRKIPLVSGAAIRMEGQIMVFRWQETAPCYRCISRLTGEGSTSCAEAGVMAPLVGVVGALQAMEAIRLLTDYGEDVTGKLLIYDAMVLQFREIKVVKNPACEICGR
ncbi:molybdopterin-synthase adenylyltransferase MoeB [Erwinia psidii]|uniref:Molybdopterin-synthase adenylyltransferase n=1 Tax=Erwinia psidii TaxID=69224 RepID=A0A3N6UZM0_9GAMM|nr:molybdopterin-synthase adenylyltransferase MoeB [Erwinia psidii]MCX8957325.1 molybdopterin-synthase adenylyltransferase MoeB [Erwinia psidii]MCX8959695.1 molybdopterin-synthase adenylyltransferase MoeB [Erwinia psidii]MCX8964638.1 molybdopterin-synthase adenylyltransferase MoeB [Erwinia psidii]RQM38245.1 molybdopterin-synthase adenylyltransferase MoeB [Erwinia psidii]